MFIDTKFMSLMFGTEVFSFMACGYFLAKLNLISAFIFFMVGLIVAFILGDAIRSRERANG